MNQNEIFICIFWYSKICWFPVKKCWCQQNSRGASRQSYILWILFRSGVIVPSFIIVGYVWQISDSPSSSIREQLQKDPSWIGLNIEKKWEDVFFKRISFEEPRITVLSSRQWICLVLAFSDYIFICYTKVRKWALFKIYLW